MKKIYILTAILLFGFSQSYSVPFYKLWSTYYGGNSDEVAKKIVTDTEGNIYITGQTRSTTISTLNSWQPTKSSDFDVFLAKFNSNGVRLWCTYLGGTAIDNVENIAVDSDNNIYIVGNTYSTEPVFNVNGWQPTKMNSSDVFLTKFNPNGQVIWSTYCGGNGADFAYGIDIDNNKNIYIAGNTSSADSMGTGGIKSTITGTGDGFIAKYTSSGTKLWSTYFGGNNNDEIKNIKLGTDKSIYLTGYTASTSGLSKNSIYQSYNGGYYDSFIAKLDSNGVTNWCGYYGGNDWDCSMSLSVDNEENIVIGGWTKSTNNIANNAFQATKTNLSEGFIAKYTNAGVLMWSSYYGGNSDDYIWSVSTNQNNDIYVTGTTKSLDMISAGESYQATKSDSNDVLIAKISSQGQLIWGSYFGGNGFDEAKSVYLSENDIFISGTTESSDQFGENGWQPIKSSNTDAFILKLTTNPPYSVININELNQNSYCCDDSIYVSFNVSNDFYQNNNYIIQLSDSAGNFINPINIDTIISNTSIQNYAVNIPKPIVISNNYRIRVVSTSPIIYSAPTVNPIQIDNGNKKLSFRAAFNGLWTDTIQKIVPVSFELRTGSLLSTSVLYKRIFTGFDQYGYLNLNLDSISNGSYWIVIRTTCFYPLATPAKIELPHCGNYMHDFTTGTNQAVGGGVVMSNYKQSGFFVIKNGDLNMDQRINSIDLNQVKPGMGTTVRTLIPEK